MKLFRIFIVSALCCAALQSGAQKILPLAGRWYVKLDPENAGVQQKWYNETFEKTIQLPGILDDAAIGKETSLTSDELKKDVLLNLTRDHSYIGAAWYQKEVVIPQAWRGQNIQLLLERVIWNTRVWIDGQEAGSGESLSTPHRFNLSALLKPGKHKIAIRIDNSKQFEIGSMAHAYTDGTQIIWNGVIGKMQLIAKDPLHIASLHTYPHVKEKSVTIATLLQNDGNRTTKAVLQLDVMGKGGVVAASQRVSVQLPAGASQKEVKLALGKGALLWDEFNSHLYTVRAKLTASALSDAATTSFGLREITAHNSQIQINGRPAFFRGTLECNIFPLTGYPPMDKKGWLKVFTTAKSYGLNHLRFHSWCPPQAAFEVADSLGFYLQIELPLWSLNVGKDQATNRFLEQEAERISTEFGNHPSFCLWSLGNELEGDFNWLNSLLQTLKQKDNRHLYSTTTFTFQNGHGKWPEPGDDYFVTQYTKKGWVRGQGIFNDYSPNFSTDYASALDSMGVPLISHEIGQYSVYPNLEEIKKYTGVLNPLNFKAIRNDLLKKNMLSLAPSFTLASGIFSAHLYKEEIERALKTKGVSGFQLLDLHDFPGQGTALVGILDAFWDSKGLVSPREHRMYCAPVVPLIRFSKAVYTNAEVFTADAEVANFSDRVLHKALPVWRVKSQQGAVLFSGAFDGKDIAVGNGIRLGAINFSLGGITKAEQLTIELQLKGTSYENRWNVWVYPDQLPKNSTDVVFTASPSEAIRYLNEGRKVLLNPDTARIKGVQGRFAPVFWSPVHFPNQPGTMGILCNPKHLALQHFPTDFYSNWQWWDLITSSKTMIIDSLPPMEPIVRVIDNFYKNRNMSNIIEAKVGKGKLILTSIDISNNLDKRPAARQLRYSLEQYMASKEFSPAIELTQGDLNYLIRD